VALATALLLNPRFFALEEISTPYGWSRKVAFAVHLCMLLVPSCSFSLEGLDSPLIYPNGISMTMPEEAQLKFLRLIPGLENVEMVRPGDRSSFFCLCFSFCFSFCFWAAIGFLS